MNLKPAEKHMNIRCGSDVTPSVATIHLDSAKRTEEKEQVALTGTMICQPLVARVAPFPRSRQVGSPITSIEACSTFTHVTASTLAESPREPLNRRLRRFHCQHSCSDFYRLQRHLSGWNVAHWSSTPVQDALIS